MASTVATPAPTARIHVPAGGWRADLRAVKIVWHRELIRFSRDRLRIVTSLFQPVLFLFVLGGGLANIASGGTEGVDLRTFMFPGALAMAVLFTAIFSAASVVWDREYGFLREMLVAPVRRGSIVLGKCLGGATVAGAQGLIVIALAPLVDVPYRLDMILALIGLQLLLAFMITAFGLMAAARVTQMQSFMALTQMLLMPLLFLSGALFPVTGLPQWLEILNRLDPLTYVVDPIRHVVFAQLDISDAAREALNPGVTWFGWHVPIGVEIGIVALTALAMLAIANAQFKRA
ncbi:ABC transporter permease [Conexibacter woesei]|uniref:Transport permease protein n=1 Tax=Conexibacter woesei (strain DSM 14684 / CCUG 47730 / CIP 108061 / JCM 11494 / NBRC 100937 / ID131577) TaxID=469383 RepID=D3F4J1_CONWI|nr:ABC transporter permease [Conexibacter woesei]ADB52448.1 ABC-2 type transporter [Conexibacter woesei DSM 14684]